MMTFEEWRAERQYVTYGVDNGVVTSCMRYPYGTEIEHWLDDRNGIAPPDGNPRWLLTLENMSYDDVLLEPLERRLYAWCMTALAPSTPADEASPEADMPHVVLFGGPLGGFKVHGPFPNRMAAYDWAEEMGEGGEWIMPVHAVTEARATTSILGARASSTSRRPKHEPL